MSINVAGSAAQHSLKKNVSKEVCFGCKGKISLFGFTKYPALREQWTRFVFPGQQQDSQAFICSWFICDECFINKAQFDTGFAHHLILKYRAVPAIKDPGHDSDGK